MGSDYNYKCPKCGGEFDVWSVSPTGSKCPFCGTQKGDYGGIS